MCFCWLHFQISGSGPLATGPLPAPGPLVEQRWSRSPGRDALCWSDRNSCLGDSEKALIIRRERERERERERVESGRRRQHFENEQCNKTPYVAAMGMTTAVLTNVIDSQDRLHPHPPDGSIANQERDVPDWPVISREQRSKI